MDAGLPTTNALAAPALIARAGFVVLRSTGSDCETLAPAAAVERVRGTVPLVCHGPAIFARLKAEWGGLDFLVHSLAFSDARELKGRYVDTSRANFLKSLDVSCFSFTAVASRAARLMNNGGAMVTLTYLGAQRVMPNYNVMGVAKAALEASVRYLAADLGNDNIRVNAISAGPMRTLAGSAVGDARMVFKWNKTHSPLKRSVELNHVGGAALYLLSDLSGGVTGEIHFVDAGFNVVGMPPTADLKGWSPPEKDQEQSNGSSPQG